ncbi:MAG: hypothetical protein EPN57_09995 [Paraburkholderia sp.]|nr:MAG: hypothetical protein EPN57_09995 [Paraburkholderia sp.]
MTFFRLWVRAPRIRICSMNLGKGGGQTCYYNDFSSPPLQRPYSVRERMSPRSLYLQPLAGCRARGGPAPKGAPKASP